MSSFLILGFEGLHTAGDAMNILRGQKKPDFTALEDACMIERGRDGKVHIKQAVNLTAEGLRAGGTKSTFWRAVVGTLFLNPLSGFAVGALTGASLGALSRSLSGYGITDEFLIGLGETLPSGSSALCVLLENGDETELLTELKSFKPRVLKTSLSKEADARLEAAVSSAFLGVR